jgi:putative membrane protein
MKPENPPQKTEFSARKAWGIVLTISTIAITFLFWLIYIKQSPSSHPEYATILPLVNASLNTFSTICIILGIVAIKKQNKKKHMTMMISAFVFSTAFLITYILYHSMFGDVAFTGQGWIRPVYFSVLITHILLTIVGLPIILMTFFFALLKQWPNHKKIAKITAPIWLIISITGVLIYILQKTAFLF